MRTVTSCAITLAVALLVAGDRLPAQQPAAKSEPPATSAPIEKVPNAPHLPNAYRLNAKVISGGLPEGDAAFTELESLGVKTVISVDGARPDVELAHKHGMTYVHLPFGYDGIPDARLAEIAKAVRDLPGPIYLHCHHGKHRSPAAAAAACVATGLLPPQDALSVLKTAGTGENYKGLYAAAQGAHRLDDATLDALKVEFRETVEPSPLGESMLAIERANDHLQLVAKAGWRTPPEHPALDAPHEALLLREQFTELLRLKEIEGRPQRFRDLAREGETDAGDLETALRAGGSDETAIAALNAAAARVVKNCADCHREFRDPPGSKAK